jgi:hypothetical protein
LVDDFNAAMGEEGRRVAVEEVDEFFNVMGRVEIVVVADRDILAGRGLDAAVQVPGHPEVDRVRW